MGKCVRIPESEKILMNLIQARLNNGKNATPFEVTFLFLVLIQLSLVH